MFPGVIATTKTKHTHTHKDAPLFFAVFTRKYEKKLNTISP